MPYRIAGRLALLALVACGGGSYNQGNDLDGDPDDTGNPSGGDDSGGDTDDTQDTDDADDTGDPVEVCDHSWHPIHTTGWTKTFDATFNSGSGTATEEGLGPSGTGDNIYVYRDAIDAGPDSYDVQITVGCDYDGEGMFVLDWSGDYSYSFLGFPIPGVLSATLNPYRRYLPPEYAVGSFGSWDYSYDLTMVTEDESGGKPSTMTFTATGQFDEYGFETIELFDGTEVHAYKLDNAYMLVETSGLFTINGYIEQWWVNGLGLVKEINTNTDDGSEIVTRELTGYTGLTIED